MCCFSGAVERVADTSIFARSVENGRQILVYAMTISTKNDVAMILPLPVPAGSPDDAVRFISLKEYPEFFTRMKLGLPEPVTRSLSVGSAKAAPEAAAPKLEVVQVGEFEASFVPAVKDFGRLDERFRLPDQTWEQLPAYKGYGFAVFKLKKTATSVHPMAFEFPRADPKQLFFPTVHIHDGKVHGKGDLRSFAVLPEARGRRTSLPDWRESNVLAGQFLSVERTGGIVDGAKHCYLKKLRGGAERGHHPDGLSCLLRRAVLRPCPGCARGSSRRGSCRRAPRGPRSRSRRGSGR